jgi:hypothetical protein
MQGKDPAKNPKQYCLEIIHPAVWDVLILNRLIEDCRAFARPHPTLPDIVGAAQAAPLLRPCMRRRLAHSYSAEKPRTETTTVPKTVFLKSNIYNAN